MSRAAPSVTDFMQRVLSKQPEPPRRLPFRETLRVVLRLKSMRILLIGGLTMAVPLLSLGLPPARDRAVVGLLCLVSSGLAVVPFIFAYHITRALRFGRASLAVVESLEYRGPGARDTLDALANGIARGTWRLLDGRRLEYEIDEPWASKISVGVRVRILITGAAATKIIPVGMEQWPGQ